MSLCVWGQSQMGFKFTLRVWCSSSNMRKSVRSLTRLLSDSRLDILFSKLTISAQDSAPPIATPTMSFSWRHSRSSLNNLTQLPSNSNLEQQLLTKQQNTIVSLPPSSQRALAPPSPNYLKYSKVWEEDWSRQTENWTNKRIAQCIFSLRNYNITKDFMCGQWLKLSRDIEHKSNTFQENVKAREENCCYQVTILERVNDN